MKRKVIRSALWWALLAVVAGAAAALLTMAILSIDINCEDFGECGKTPAFDDFSETD